jgi:hypothetical protein
LIGIFSVQILSEYRNVALTGRNAQTKMNPATQTQTVVLGSDEIAEKYFIKK